MSDFASLIFLSYNRPQFIFEAIESASSQAGYPHEIIVVDDGSTDNALIDRLRDEQAYGHISTLVTSVPGHNEGVGHGINVGFKLAAGDPIIKIDQDMLFTDGWLARTVGILRQDDAIGMLGLFKYHYEPVIWSDKLINVPTKGGYHYTRQFCGSAMAIPRRVWDALGPFAEHSDAFCEDSEKMADIRHAGYELALPDVDLAHNRGFGIGPSTVVEEGYVVHKIHHGPFVVSPSEPEPSEFSHPPQNEVISPNENQESFEYDWSLPTEVINGAMEATRRAEERRFDVGVVITTCVGREDNVRRVLQHLGQQTLLPLWVVVVCDGCTPDTADLIQAYGHGTLSAFEIPKHGPGVEQPRNVGFRKLREIVPQANYVWFVDSDIILLPDTLAALHRGLLAAEEDRILIAPYDWLGPGVTEPDENLKNDPRWVSFDEHGPEKILRYDLGASLANFAGNLVWPVSDFERVGGFHPQLHHGRCEDGELGLRAGSAGVGMSFVREARGWHVWHPIDLEAIYAKNQRDVPLLNAIHPWVEGQGLLLTEKDGVRFDWSCPDCGAVVNSLEYWQHTNSHKPTEVAA